MPINSNTSRYRYIAISATMFVVLCISTGGAYLMTRIDDTFTNQSQTNNRTSKQTPSFQAISLSPTNGATLQLAIPAGWDIDQAGTNFWKQNLNPNDTWLLVDQTRPTLKLLAFRIQTTKPQTEEIVIDSVFRKIFSLLPAVKLQKPNIQKLPNTLNLPAKLIVTKGTLTEAENDQPIVTLHWLIVIQTGDSTYWILNLMDQIPKEHEQAANLTDQAIVSNIINSLKIIPKP